MITPIEIRSVFIAAEESPLASHQSALKYWNRLRGGRWAPAWREVSLLDFPAQSIPSINVTDIVPTPLSSTYRFWGTNLTEVFGRDFRGKSPADVPPRALGLGNDGGCGRLCYDKAPHCEVREFRAPRGYRGRALALRLPCSDNGKDVSHGISVYHFEHVDPKARLDWFFREVFEPLDRQSLVQTAV